MREGDAATRFALASALLAHLEVRDGVRWPLPDSQGEAIDFAGLDAQGRPVAGVARAELGLAALGPVLDAWVALVPRLPAIFARASGVASLERPALVVAAERLDAPAARILACLDADLRCLEASRRGREPSFVSRALPELAAGAPLHRTPALSRDRWSRRGDTVPCRAAPGSAAGASRRDARAGNRSGRAAAREPARRGAVAAPLRGAVRLRSRRGRRGGRRRAGGRASPAPPAWARSRSRSGSAGDGE